MKNLYDNKKRTKRIEVYQENEFVYYKELSLFEKKVYQIPSDRLGRSISFSRTYHALFFITIAFLSFLALQLILKKWNTGNWTLYLGLIVLFLIFISMIYYLIIGKNYGEVELDFGDLKLHLYMKKKEYLEFQERLDTLNQ